MAFVSTVTEIEPRNVYDSSKLAAAVSYWSEGALAPEEWLRWMEDSWGPAGLTMRRGEEMLGFAVYGPIECFPRADRFSAEQHRENTILLAYLDGDRRAKKHLIVRMLKELRYRGGSSVEALASDFGCSHHVPTRFLLENGWQPMRRVRYAGRSYTVMRADLGSVVEVGELARGIIGRVKLPKLKNTPPVPGEACVQAGSSFQVELPSESGSTAVFTDEIPSGVVA